MAAGKRQRADDVADTLAGLGIGAEALDRCPLISYLINAQLNKIGPIFNFFFRKKFQIAVLGSSQQL